MYDLPPWKSELQYWTSVAAGFGSLLGVVAVYLTYVSAKAARLSAQAARMSADSVMKGDRAWVLVEPTFNGEMGFKFRLPEPGRVGLFTIELQNVGKTPAQIDAVSVTGRVVESSSYQGELGENVSPRQVYHGRLLVSDKPLQKGVVVDYNPDWGNILSKELVDGNAFILIQAHVVYRDIYEKPHETKIALILAWTGKESVDGIEPRVSQAGGAEWNVVT